MIALILTGLALAISGHSTPQKPDCPPDAPCQYCKQCPQCCLKDSTIAANPIPPEPVKRCPQIQDCHGIEIAAPSKPYCDPDGNCCQSSWPFPYCPTPIPLRVPDQWIAIYTGPLPCDPTPENPDGSPPPCHPRPHIANRAGIPVPECGPGLSCGKCTPRVQCGFAEVDWPTIPPSNDPIPLI
jgi:hypothetical protein